MNFRIKTYSATTIQPPQGRPPPKVLIKLGVKAFTTAATFKHFIFTKTKIQLMIYVCIPAFATEPTSPKKLNLSTK